MSEIEQEFVVPMEATERGLLIIGELKSEGAVFPLMGRELVLELRIARLFSGIQGALVFALQELRGKKRAQVRSLYEKFLSKYGSHFDDLWPLLRDPQGGPSLSDLRNAEPRNSLARRWYAGRIHTHQHGRLNEGVNGSWHLLLKQSILSASYKMAMAAHYEEINKWRRDVNFLMHLR